jgi:hypothetical protein
MIADRNSRGGPVATTRGTEFGWGWAQTTLAVLIAAFGLATLCVTLTIIIESYAPVLFWDHWDIIQELRNHNSAITWPELWALHNEHRIPTGRLLYFADLFLFHGKNVSLLVEIVLIQLAQVTTLLFVASRFGRFKPALLCTVAGFLCYCFFNPLQIINFVWPFQVHFLLGILLGVLSLTAAVWSTTFDASDRVKRELVFAGALVLAFLAESSLATGLLTWPVLLVLAFTCRMSAMRKLAISGFGACAILAYLFHYAAPPGPNPIDALSRPLRLVKFAITELAYSWDRTLPNASLWPHVSEVACFASLLLAMAWVGWTLRRSSDALSSFLLSAFLYLFGSLALTAIGRVGFGYIQATESRYQSVAFLYWACFALLVAQWLSRRMARSNMLLLVQAACLVLQLYSLTRWKGSEEWALNQRLNLLSGWNALMENPADLARFGGLYSHPEWLPQLAAYLKAHHWGPSGRVHSDVALSSGKRGSGLSKITARPVNQCAGFLDDAFALNGDQVHVWGWVYDVDRGSTLKEVVLADNNGNVLKKADIQIFRPDVQRANQYVQSSNSGWEMNISLPHNGLYFAYGIDAAGHACAIQNSVRISRPHHLF